MEAVFNSLVQTPITVLITISLFLLQVSDSVQWADCTNNSFTQHLLHSFLHANTSHLLVNLYSIYRLAYLEAYYGSSTYSILVAIMLILSSYIQHIFGRMEEAGYFPFPTCAVGFSAAILGLIVFQNIVQNQGVDLGQMRQMLLLLIMPFLKNPRASLSGHLAGILAGTLVASLVGGFGG